MKKYKGYEYEYRGVVRLSRERLEQIDAAIERGIDRVVDGGESVVSWASLSSVDVPLSYLERVVIRLEVES